MLWRRDRKGHMAEHGIAHHEAEVNAPCRTIHQIFFQFNEKRLQDFPRFVASQEAFRNMIGWRYHHWDEPAVEQLCRRRYPEHLSTYLGLRHDIQRVDMAKYLISGTYPSSLILYL